MRCRGDRCLRRIIARALKATGQAQTGQIARKFVWLLSNYDVDFVPTFCYISHIPLTSGVSGDVPKAGGKSKARAQKRAAGTKKTALFDIVNREWRERRTANGSVDAIA
jgi:hypothetical protein